MCVYFYVYLLSYGGCMTVVINIALMQSPGHSKQFCIYIRIRVIYFDKNIHGYMINNLIKHIDGRKSKPRMFFRTKYTLCLKHTSQTTSV